MINRFLLLLILSFPSWGQSGQSFKGGTSGQILMNTVNLANSVSWRVEFQVSGGSTGSLVSYPYTPTNDWLDDNGTGIHLDIVNGGTTLQATNVRDTAVGLCQVPLSANTVVRIQRMLSSTTFTTESWNVDGSNYLSCARPFTANPSYAGSSGGTAASLPVDLAFYRIFTSTIAVNSTRPTTADASGYLECKLDGTLTCAGTSPTFTLFAGTPGYIVTPGLIAYATIKTPNAPSWTNWISLRAGAITNQLDGTGSISMTPASSSVTFQWQSVSCDSNIQPRFNSRTASQPIVFGLIRGTCTFRNTVTDAAGNIGTQTLAVGAVATDNNHIVIDPQQSFSDAVFGQQIAFGYNPFPYQDWANMNGVNVMAAQMGGPTSGLSISDDWNAQLGGVSDTCSISGTTLTCTAGINLQTTFGGGTNTWVGGNGVWPIIWYNDGPDSRTGRFPLNPASGASITSATTMTLDYSTYNWPGATNAVCSVGNPCKLAASRNWLSAISTASPYGYYDMASGFRAFERRSGMTSAGLLATQLAGIEVTAPSIDSCVNNGVQARINPTRQWTIEQIYNPGNAFASAFQLGLRNCAVHFGAIYTGTGYSFSPYNQIVNAANFACRAVPPSAGGFCFTDVRDNGAALMDVAAAAYIETDPTWQATLNGILEFAWTGFWSTQLQSDGHWDQSMGGAPTSVPADFVNGSTSVVPHNGGDTFPSTQCGTLVTNTGHVTFTNGTTTVTGSGTNFSGAITGDILVLFGKFSGVYGKQVFQINSVLSGTSLTTSQPIYLDTDNSGTAIFQITLGASGLLPFFVVTKSDSSGASIPLTPDSNWYTCKWIDSTHLTLDQNFQIASEIGRIVQESGGGGDFYTLNQGSQPYMDAFPAAGFELGALVGTAHAAQMLSAARGIYPFHSTTAWAPIAKGAYFAVLFGDCQPLFEGLAGCGSAVQSMRMFAVEPMRALAATAGWQPMTTPVKTFLTAMYCAQWGNSAYDSQSCDDGQFVDDCADGFTAGKPVKQFGICFGIGSTAAMPAALAGGLAPAAPFTINQQFLLTKPYPTATKYVMNITAPSGATSSVTCTTSPCTATLDSRQGQHIVQGQWFNNTTLLGQTQQFLVNPS